MARLKAFWGNVPHRWPRNRPDDWDPTDRQFWNIVWWHGSQVWLDTESVTLVEVVYMEARTNRMHIATHWSPFVTDLWTMPETYVFDDENWGWVPRTALPTVTLKYITG